MTKVIVVDSPNSALAIAARSRVRFQKAEILYCSNFGSPQKLCAELVQRNFDIIFFAWRQALYEIAKSPETSKYLALLRNRSSVGVLIPDYIGVSNSHFDKESELIDFADYYLVTNRELFEIYSNGGYPKKPLGLLHDIPNLELLEMTYNLNLPRNNRKAIWVGNSKWGKRQGFQDHKGFLRVVKPLGDLLKKHDNCFDLQVIDSSKLLVSQDEILRYMSGSNYILQTSASEGTGMPLLEGMALGLTPISTSVGVAPEILLGPLSQNIIDSSPDSFHEALHLNMDSPRATRASIRELFELYSIEAMREVILGHSETFQSAAHTLSRSGSAKSRLEWQYRFWKNR